MQGTNHVPLKCGETSPRDFSKRKDMSKNMSKDMSMRSAGWQPGVLAALGSAFLFGAGTPLAKWLLAQVSPWMLAGLLYLGSGIGLGVYRQLRGASRPRLNPGEMRWLMAAVLCGGGLAPRNWR